MIQGQHYVIVIHNDTGSTECQIKRFLQNKQQVIIINLAIKNISSTKHLRIFGNVLFNKALKRINNIS
jgi:hypothetical protein